MAWHEAGVVPLLTKERNSKAWPSTVRPSWVLELTPQKVTSCVYMRITAHIQCSAIHDAELAPRLKSDCSTHFGLSCRFQLLQARPPGLICSRSSASIDLVGNLVARAWDVAPALHCGIDINILMRRELQPLSRRMIE